MLEYFYEYVQLRSAGIHLRWIYNKFLEDFQNLRHLVPYVRDLADKTLTFQVKVSEALTIEDQIQKSLDGVLIPQVRY